MRILGIESSCDETAAAIVEDGKYLISNVVNSQIDIHKEYGGVVPEVAARSHVEVVNSVVKKALADAKMDWDDIDAIGVTYAPGLSGSLLIGTLAAKTVAYLKNKPLYPIHHIKAHVFASFITEKSAQIPFELPKHQPEFPILALIVSGGHTQLMLFDSATEFKIIGQTQDDAVGEAFDKIAKIIGLPYPGGPSISEAAKAGDPDKYKLPIARLDGEYDFSFSGLKTAVLRAVQKEVGVDFTFPSHELAGLLSKQQRNDFAASFQKIAVKTLVDKTKKAFYKYNPKSVVLAGGVAANQELRRQIKAEINSEVIYPPIQLCTDNATMIASLAYFEAQTVIPTSPFNLEIKPSLELSQNASEEK